MDRGACLATGHGVAESQTQLGIAQHTVDLAYGGKYLLAY